jgi:hypothetical protein
VIASFDVISESAPHIYHSALPLSPQASIVRKLYESYAYPFVRVVQGLQISWDPVVATAYCVDSVKMAVWSPCCRFIAVAWTSSSHSVEVEILDAVTLRQLNILESSQESQHHSSQYRSQWLSFSADSSLLMCLNYPLYYPADRDSWEDELISWDLQTGGTTSTFLSGLHTSPRKSFSSTYSMDGKMFAVAYKNFFGSTRTTISTYNLLSNTHIYSHHVSKGCIVAPIWIHGECLQFVTVNTGSITIWEVGFASADMLVEVEFLSAPDNIGDSGEYLFLPSRSWLAFTLQEAVLVWDAQNSKLLLNFVCSSQPGNMSFSSSGHFFACAISQYTHLWKESSTGYIPHQTLISTFGDIGPLLSPDGESIITSTGPGIQLSHTMDPSPFLSSIQTQPTRPSDFILEFSPDETLGAVARLNGNTATVLNLKSGNPQLTIDTGMNIRGLRVAGSTIAVVGEGKVATWNIPTGDCALSARVNIDNSIQTTVLNDPRTEWIPTTPNTSISPDFKYIAITLGARGLSIYDGFTGNYLTGVEVWGERPRFTPDGCEVWCHSVGPPGWAIVEDSESGLIKLESLASTVYPPELLPYQSSCGYEVTINGWVLSSRGKRLFWLPHHWRSHLTSRVWSGQFLGLLHFRLPVAVILELDE